MASTTLLDIYSDDNNSEVNEVILGRVKYAVRQVCMKKRYPAQLAHDEGVTDFCEYGMVTERPVYHTAIPGQGRSIAQEYCAITNSVNQGQSIKVVSNLAGEVPHDGYSSHEEDQASRRAKSSETRAEHSGNTTKQTTKHTTTNTESKRMQRNTDYPNALTSASKSTLPDSRLSGKAPREVRNQHDARQKAEKNGCQNRKGDIHTEQELLIPPKSEATLKRQIEKCNTQFEIVATARPDAAVVGRFTHAPGYVDAIVGLTVAGALVVAILVPRGRRFALAVALGLGVTYPVACRGWSAYNRAVITAKEVFQQFGDYKEDEENGYVTCTIKGSLRPVSVHSQQQTLTSTK